MKTNLKIINLIPFLFLLSCFHKENITPFTIEHKDNILEFSINITSKKRINGSYHYYGSFLSKILVNDIQNKSFPHYKVLYNNQLSSIYIDSTVDYGNFWRKEKWKNKKRVEKVYLVFEEEKLDPSKLSVKKLKSSYYYWPYDSK